ncbi:MAG: DUF5317 domain-containing protein [Acidimicrobiia bacterium]|nr:DUF5317 domain-containing protein [Acidimicrobiia bacterium]
MLWLFVVLAVSVAVSLLRGGKLSNIAEIYARGWWLLFVGLGMQTAANFISTDQREVAVWLVLLSYIPLLAVVALNQRLPGMWIAGIGILMNFTVIALNNGMPVLPEAFELAGGDPERMMLDAKHVVLDSESRLPFLADIIPMPGSVISLGDVLLAVGLGVFVEDQLHQPLRLFRHRVQGLPGSAAERDEP